MSTKRLNTKPVTTNAGYSGTPLATKLGIKSGFRLLVIRSPREYPALLKPLPDNVLFTKTVSEKTDLVHLFVTRKDQLIDVLLILRKKTRPEIPVWISWPKKSSGMPTTVTEDVIREVALPMGYVDIKVCAVDDVWSGLKLVISKRLR